MQGEGPPCSKVCPLFSLPLKSSCLPLPFFHRVPEKAHLLVPQKTKTGALFFFSAIRLQLKGNGGGKGDDEGTNRDRSLYLGCKLVAHASVQKLATPPGAARAGNLDTFEGELIVVGQLFSLEDAS